MATGNKTYRVDVVVPCFNEEAALPQTAPQLMSYFRALVADSSTKVTDFRILFVNDGSQDSTWSIITEMAKNEDQILGINLSRNFGHQAAMLAGLTLADADVVLTMDADLQDDISAVRAMIAAYETGSHLALGVRNDRTSDSAHKKGAANAYYRFLALMGVNIIENHADFRLMSRIALDALLQHQETNLFLRGLIPTLGFPVTLVPYKRQVRTAGETKYTLRKMIGLALNGITSFSITPLRIIALTGTLIFTGSFVVGSYFLWQSLTHSDILVPGWASTVLPLLFIGGMQLLSIGVLGEYIGKIYLETKRRPRFIIQETTAVGTRARPKES
jgi:glycosyltransferase involved in cell wall biosynthesis